MKNKNKISATAEAWFEARKTSVREEQMARIELQQPNRFELGCCVVVFKSTDDLHTVWNNGYAKGAQQMLKVGQVEMQIKYHENVLSCNWSQADTITPFDFASGLLEMLKKPITARPETKHVVHDESTKTAQTDNDNTTHAGTRKHEFRDRLNCI